MKYIYIGLLFTGFLSTNSCTRSKPMQLEVSASKDTAWLYPAYLNPLMNDKRVLVTMESNINSCGYLLIDNETMVAVSMNGNRKETRVKSSSKRMIPTGTAKTYFTESYRGPTRFSYKSCGASIGKLKITMELIDSDKIKPKGFAILPLTTNKTITRNSLQTVN